MSRILWWSKSEKNRATTICGKRHHLWTSRAHILPATTQFNELIIDRRESYDTTAVNIWCHLRGTMTLEIKGQALQKLTAVVRASSNTGAFRPGTGWVRRSYGSCLDDAGGPWQSSDLRRLPTSPRGRRLQAGCRLRGRNSGSSAAEDRRARTERPALMDNCERTSCRYDVIPACHSNQPIDNY